ncbi:flp pilus-assembly TadE/G-like family protein [Rhodococcus sp. IEGM 1401]|uniref:Rv3654c family TadE-like protein n=1 Tax=unclassified Rhodococcus (in: high G+C Gram-positive bacteria) TaxID=192944 RepID=UPI0022B495F5|nr:MULTISPECIES: Rv3654c family TadE-like protein [unclassified Rhodococcus (in: high G+C Gram-positive bacteria)]MCZ4562909.1 flp pilus-assembly TadE/G-like family protein [Rhodococcus sp. IEGM 1401]MDI9923060.1 flp pilus-assembly TadE/G-like family protein [Rhodococcus sp. IEGM 1372]MDV8035579.1 flp pilus-assembly TadE/G-like family protein [Rhodococcus sp. IEGM 1414]
MRDDEGGATVLAALAMSALIVVVVMVMHVGSAVGARHQAQSAADLAALAGAGALDRGVADACETARGLAGRMGTRLRECTIDEWDVIVTVGQPVFLGRFGMSDAIASARAGPG